METEAAYWDRIFSGEDYSYGTEPNLYFKSKISKLPAGRILLLGEGEGRNAVYAAEKGWEVHATDISATAREKALQLAKKRQVNIRYYLGDPDGLPTLPKTFDAIALIFVHLTSEKRAHLIRQAIKRLRPGGTFIMEVYSINHLPLVIKHPETGGPRKQELLYGIEEIPKLFPEFNFLEFQEKAVNLQEGFRHNGVSSVIRFTGKKHHL